MDVKARIRFLNNRITATEKEIENAAKRAAEHLEAIEEGAECPVLLGMAGQPANLQQAKSIERPNLKAEPRLPRGGRKFDA